MDRRRPRRAWSTRRGRILRPVADDTSRQHGARIPFKPTYRTVTRPPRFPRGRHVPNRARARRSRSPDGRRGDSRAVVRGLKWTVSPPIAQAGDNGGAPRRAGPGGRGKRRPGRRPERGLHQGHSCRTWPTSCRQERREHETLVTPCSTRARGGAGSLWQRCRPRGGQVPAGRALRRPRSAPDDLAPFPARLPAPRARCAPLSPACHRG